MSIFIIYENAEISAKNQFEKQRFNVKLIIEEGARSDLKPLNI